MTWEEFKEKVEAEGVTDDTELGTINVRRDATLEDLFVKVWRGVAEIDGC